MDNICIYRHIKPNGEVFYIGIGNNKRPYVKKRRSKFWLKITNKYPDYEIDVLKKDLNIEDARELEIILISYYGRRCDNKGKLCNLTLGGEGTFGLIHSEELRRKNSESKKGRKVWNKGILATDIHKKNLKKSSAMAKKVICTKASKIWDSGQDCANENKINYVTLMQKLNGTRNNKTTFKFLKNE